MAQSVKRPISAQVMHDLTVCGFQPHVGLWLTAQSLKPASDSVCLSLCPLPLSLSLSLSLSLKYRQTLKKFYKEEEKKAAAEETDRDGF